ncbi:Hypothetical predicted protein [Olea europaea subsp. europaea]|uniref:Uncharacterized protein n=1 Tax=Olea europaea subsp. europaea TaxID=158383 RepID=A0A8S0SH76_OLEEU|nr:Hypothetical predicted protein [Olea europaea subsp. europaea]
MLGYKATKVAEAAAKGNKREVPLAVSLASEETEKDIQPLKKYHPELSFESLPPRHRLWCSQARQLQLFTQSGLRFPLLLQSR